MIGTHTITVNDNIQFENGNGGVKCYEIMHKGLTDVHIADGA